MNINPAIEEKAKAFTNNTPTTETDAEFLQRSYEFAQDIYQLGVSDRDKRIEARILALANTDTVKDAIKWAREQVTLDTSHANEGAEISGLFQALTKTS